MQCRQGNRVPEASPLIAGLELGLYNFAASGLQAVGLQYTTATRGSLLILVLPSPIASEAVAACCLEQGPFACVPTLLCSSMKWFAQISPDQPSQWQGSYAE